MSIDIEPAAVTAELPTRVPVNYVSDLGDIIERARTIMNLSDQERNARMAVHGLYIINNLNADTLHYAAQLAHRAMIARITGRQMLTGNRLIAYPLRADDIIVRPSSERCALLGAHHQAGDQAGKLAVGNEIHFAINGPRGDAYDTLAYLAITTPGEDRPTGLHVGIPYERLGSLEVIDRDQAYAATQQAGPVTAPQGAPVFSL